MSLDFSQKIDLTPLAVVVRALQSVAQPINPASTSNKPAD
jgi:hypothetical protein